MMARLLVDDGPASVPRLGWVVVLAAAVILALALLSGLDLVRSLTSGAH